jgi:hypothetical protein
MIPSGKRMLDTAQNGIQCFIIKKNKEIKGQDDFVN